MLANAIHTQPLIQHKTILVNDEQLAPGNR